VNNPGYVVRMDELEYGWGSEDGMSVWRALTVAAVILMSLSACAGPEAQRQKEDAAQSQYDIGVGALAEGKLPKAVASFEQAVRDDPPNARYHYALGNALIRMGKFEDAIPPLRQAVELNPRLSDAYNDLAACYIQQQKWDQAIEALRRALANPQYLTPDRAYLNLGNVYFSRGQYDLAEEQFRKVVDIVPQLPDGYFLLGRTLMAEGRVADAREQFERAVKLDGTIAVFQYELGMALLKEGRKAEARDSLRRAVELSPLGPEADSARQALRDLR
jgi:tetratricopeptide (TPR) repeat protein